jgi:hypothetical protein
MVLPSTPWNLAPEPPVLITSGRCGFLECPDPIGEAVDPYRLTARGSLLTCVEFSRKHMHWDEHATACEQALGALDRTRPALDEVFPTPGWSGFALRGSPPDPDGRSAEQ